MRNLAKFLGLLLAIPASAQADGPACAMPLITSVPLTIESGAPVLPVMLDGKETKFTFVPVANLSMLSRDVAESLHLTLRTDFRRTRVKDQQVTLEQAEVESVAIGNMHGATLRFEIQNQPLRPGVAGYLGMDILRNVDFEIDVPGGKFNLFKPNVCPNQGVYWSDKVSELRLDPSYGGWIVFGVEVDGKPMQAVFNPTATYSYLTFKGAQRLGIDRDDPSLPRETMRFREGPRQIAVTRVGQVTLGGEVVKQATLRIIDGFNGNNAPYSDYTFHPVISGPRVDAPELVLGLDFARTHRIYISSQTNVIGFTYQGGQIFQPPVGAGGPAAR